ncbi:MAG: efflux RND transporter periplasmic adaptor subunit [Acidobacteriota bacterium]
MSALMSRLRRSLTSPSDDRRVALLLAVVPVGTALLLAPGCGKPPARGAAPPVPIRAALAERKTVPLEVRAVGTVESIQTVAVKARVGGELVTLGFGEGEAVTRGSTLFVIDPRPYEAALREAEARLARDRAQLVKAEADVTRYADLVRKDFVTREQYDQITAAAEALRATVRAEEAAVETARLNLSFCTIAAPVAGRTGNLLIRPGNLVKANDDKALVTINQTRPIYVAFSLPGRLLAEIQKRRNDGIRVLARPSAGTAEQEGRLTFIDNQVDIATGTVLFKATFANEIEALWPGQFVEVTVVLGQEANRVVVPASAVLTGQQGQFVYVVKDDGTAEMRSVTTARTDEREAVIAEGLGGGETVVTDGQLRLVPGSRVQKMEADAGREERP